VIDSTLSDGVFWKGSHYWVTGRHTGKTTSSNPTNEWRYNLRDTLLPVFDSLFVHRYDGTTTEVTPIAVQDSLVTHAVLQPFGDHLLLLESQLLLHKDGLYSLSDYLGTIHSSKDGLLWDEAPWISDSGRVSLKTLVRLRFDGPMFGVQWQFLPIGDSLLISNSYYDSTYIYATPIQPFPARINASGIEPKIPWISQITPIGSSIVFTTANGHLRRAPLSDLSDWHHIGSSNLSTRRLLPWRGLLLAADDTVLRASSPIPASF
jgi:hypothetical protein